MSDNINNIMICKKCNNEIDQKIGNVKICRSCHNATFREFYKNKIKIANGYKDKNGHNVEYTNDKGQIINIIIKNDFKICRICNIEKNYNLFCLVNSTYKGNTKKYLSADCKECTKLISSNKKQLLQNMIKNASNIISNDIINNNEFCNLVY